MNENSDGSVVLCLADGEKLATKFVIDAGADNALVEFDGNVRD